MYYWIDILYYNLLIVVTFILWYFMSQKALMYVISQEIEWLNASTTFIFKLYSIQFFSFLFQ